MTVPKRTTDWAFTLLLSILIALSTWTLNTVNQVDKRLSVMEDRYKQVEDHEVRLRGLEYKPKP